MTARRGIAIAATVAMVVATTVVASTNAETTDASTQTAEPTATPTASRVAVRERPRGAVEGCSRISGFGSNLREFTLRRNLVVGPFALLRAGHTLPYAHAVEGNKVFVLVKGGHRVTLELSRQTRRDVGLVFGKFPSANVTLRHARRVVTFKACQRGESADSNLDSWPVSGWVGFLLATSPQCVPLLVWVDDEPSPRRAAIRFGVRSCD
jgi:hypothetical protein